MNPRILIFVLSLSLACPLMAQTEDLVGEVLNLMGKGRYPAAEEKALQGSSPLVVRLSLELAKRRGDGVAVRNRAQRLLNLYRAGQLQTSSQMSQAAYAAWQLDLWQDSNQIYIEAAKLSPVSPSLYVDWGHLYLQKYNPGEAEAIFSDALAALQLAGDEERWQEVDIHLGMAKTLGAAGRPTAPAVESAEKADAENLDLMAFKIHAMVEESSWVEAEELLTAGLKLNKNFVPFLQAKAASHYFQKQDKEFEKIRSRILEINASNGEVFEIMGSLAVNRRRFDDAIAFFRAAVSRNPGLWSAVSALGINLLRAGFEEEGKQVLKRAFANDPFNLWTRNTLVLLDSFENFTRFQTEHVSAKIETDEVAALRPYVEELLERSLAELEEKYDHQLSERVVFEMYSNHDDFAVRTLGLPGLGALGATFGRVVAMDSPSARPGGKFHWGSTLWHEIAHVITLSLSQNRVPRWFTEGISMMEERLAVEGWGDFLTPQFVEAWSEDKLLSLAELDAGFLRPKFPGQLELSYFQAGWLCDFLAATYGAGKIRAMLLAFGEEKSGEQVFEEVLGVSIDEVDQAFKEEMRNTMEPLVAKLKPPEEFQLGNEELELATLRQSLETNPDNYFLNLRLAHRLIQADQAEEAVPLLEKAIEIFPYLASENSPHSMLVQIYEKEEDRQKLIEALERWWSVAPRFYSIGERLGQLQLEDGQIEKAGQTLKGVMFVDPLKPRAHQLLGQVFLKQEDHQRAVVEFEVLKSMAPPDIAGAHYLLAQALAGSGENQRARREVLLALEIAPTYVEAQKLLLELVKP